MGNLPGLMWQDDSGQVLTIHDHLHNRQCKSYPFGVIARTQEPKPKPDHRCLKGATAILAEASKPFLPYFPASQRGISR